SFSATAAPAPATDCCVTGCPFVVRHSASHTETQRPVWDDGERSCLIGEGVDERLVEGGEILRHARRDQVAVDDQLLVDVPCPGVFDVIADLVDRGDGLPLED